jgi:diguanylate cyclase (GGDEF)-like protein
MQIDHESADTLQAAIATMSSSYEESMRVGRGQDAERTALACLAEGLSVATLYEQVIAPAMARIGDIWAEGEMTIADEHLASAPALALAVESRRPDIVALAVPTESARPAAAQSVRELRRLRPEIPVLIGGKGAGAGPMEAGETQLSPLLAGLVDTVAGLVLEGRPVTPSPPWTTSLAMPLRASASGEDASPEDRLLEIASEAADAARAHARVAHAYRRLAHEDPLTGAPNRRAFDDRIEELLAGGVEAGLILIDLDGFKRVNDRLGHPAGDRVLRRVATVIAEGIPADAFMARLGGDEFAVLLPRSTNESPDVLASALLVKLRESGDDTEVAITATAGVAPLAGDRRQSLIQADLALYRAKAAGGDAVAAG